MGTFAHPAALAGLATLLCISACGLPADQARADTIAASSPENVPAVPTPTVPPPAECSYVTGQLKDLGVKHGSFSPDLFKVTGDLSELGCITDLIAEIKRRAKNWNQAWNDEEFAVTLSEIVFPDYTNKGYQKVGVHSNGAVCDYLYKGDMPGGKKLCGSGHFFMDANSCNIIPAPNGTECGGLELNYYRGCPVSLLLDQDAEVGREQTVVWFSLDANAKQWTLWKASDKAPLLVYDPRHTGSITSASQLFGFWTFGGRSLASLAEEHNQPRPWKDGYEALASLDADQNGKVDGVELDPIGLWFDANKDAVSQPGEVKSVREFGITALYYNPDSTNSGGDLVARRGFDRTVDGRTYSGASVDWFSESAPSPAELIQKLRWTSAVEEAFAAPSSAPPQKADEAGQDIERKKGGRFSGVWKWSMDAGQDGTLPGGYLVFASAGSKSVFGYSLMELQLAKAPLPNIGKAGAVFTLEGREEDSNQGASRLVFSSEHNGSRILSEAVLSADGTTLSGHSTASGIVDGQSVQFTYVWTAAKEQLDN